MTQTIPAIIAPHQATAATAKATSVSIDYSRIVVNHSDGTVSLYKISSTGIWSGTAYEPYSVGSFDTLPGEPDVLVGSSKVRERFDAYPPSTFSLLSGKGWNPSTWVYTPTDSTDNDTATAVTVALKNRPDDAANETRLIPSKSVGYLSGIVTVAHPDGTTKVHFAVSCRASSYGSCINPSDDSFTPNGDFISVDGGDYIKASSGKFITMETEPDAVVAIYTDSTKPEEYYSTGYDAFYDGLLFALKNKPTTSNKYVAQMPTTGAPEGIAKDGIYSVGIILVGLAIVVARRRVS